MNTTTSTAFDIVPQTTVIREVFECVQTMYESGVMRVPNGMLLHEFLENYRGRLYRSLIKLPPFKRLTTKQHVRDEYGMHGLKMSAFLFYGLINDAWVFLGAKMSPDAAGIDDIMNDPEMFVDAEGWLYHLKHPGVRMGVYR